MRVKHETNWLDSSPCHDRDDDKTVSFAEFNERFSDSQTIAIIYSDIGLALLTYYCRTVLLPVHRNQSVCAENRAFNMGSCRGT